MRSRYLVMASMLTLGLLLSIVVATPLLIRGNVTLMKKFVLEEDIFEALLIAALLALAYTAHRVYRGELESLKKSNIGLTKSHTEAFKYIGTVNVQLQRLGAIFSGWQRYPETKTEFQRMLASAVRSIGGMVKVDWTLIRIIDQEDFRTITEHWESFAKEGADQHIRISNRALVEGKPIEGFSVVCSRRNNLAVNVACIMPAKELVREEKILIEAIVGELEMLFIIFTLQNV